ncbi:MAG: reverse transcriptase/maturase family protein [Candidatus Aenigmatarchaeota archaeon]
MKTYSNLYPRICSIENLHVAFRKARKGKNNRSYVKKFEADLANNLRNLQTDLMRLTYSPAPPKVFAIRDPKSRIISAPNFRDRIVHHAIHNIIQSIFEKAFIYDSFANQIDKGTHKAIERFDKFKRKVSGNGKLIRNSRYTNQAKGYVLKADIRHYFDTVDHETLMKIINRKIKDKFVVWLIRTVLNNHNTGGRGMPLGNLTSQFFANVYLNELDYFVKHGLRTKYYIRYVDDFVILHISRRVLKYYQNQIDEFLRSRLRIELHPDKTKIFPIYHGTSFLGFRVYYYHKLLKKSNVRHFRIRLDWLIQLYRSGDISDQTLNDSVAGWMEYARYGNTWKMRKDVSCQLNSILKLQ